MKEQIRMNWLKGMYLANVLISGPLGLATLVAPATMRALMGIPAGDPVNFGIAAGAVPLAFGIAGAIGLRRPLRMAPVLLIQVLYKSLFLVGLVLPLAVRGTVPSYSVPLIALFALFIVGDLIALPFPYLFSESVET
jgi:hypothetical protein